MYSKELLKGTLEVIVLKLLSENKEMYGYEIAQQVKELTSGKILIKDGSLYPALHKMLHDGKVSFREEKIGKRVRKYYFLTKVGEKEKENQLHLVDDFIQTLQKILYPQISTNPL